MSTKILVIAAHPDDEILGCGGTIAKLAKADGQVYTLILGTGVASRYETENGKEIKSQIEELKRQLYAANETVGVKEVFIHNFPDNKFDTVALLDIVKVIEKIKTKIKPEVVFTHYLKDLNIDHQITYQAVITAARPLSTETVREIYSFEVPSSTEWAYPLSFAPDVFFDITETVDLKIKAISSYKSELREFPHPRSIKGLELNAQVWGMKAGVRYAEAFKAVRILR